MNPPPCAVEQDSFTRQQQHPQGNQAQDHSNPCRSHPSVSVLPFCFVCYAHALSFLWPLLRTKNTRLHLRLIRPGCFCQLAAGLVYQSFPLPALPIQSSLSLAMLASFEPLIPPTCTTLHLTSTTSGTLDAWLSIQKGGLISSLLLSSCHFCLNYTSSSQTSFSSRRGYDVDLPRLTSCPSLWNNRPNVTPSETP